MQVGGVEEELEAGEAELVAGEMFFESAKVVVFILILILILHPFGQNRWLLRYMCCFLQWLFLIV